jgi:hypothetical protein
MTVEIVSVVAASFIYKADNDMVSIHVYNFTSTSVIYLFSSLYSTLRSCLFIHARVERQSTFIFFIYIQLQFSSNISIILTSLKTLSSLFIHNYIFIIFHFTFFIIFLFFVFVYTHVLLFWFSIKI